MASQFSFSKHNLPELQTRPQKFTRTVNRSLERLSAWVSSVGAAVALNDLDADGLANDLCYVDPRIDEVIVAPAASSPPRYAPFALSAWQAQQQGASVAPMGCLPGDYNEDGLMDILVYYWGRTPLIFLQKEASGGGGGGAGRGLSRESYEVVELVSGEERWYTNAATLADLDGDGHTDIIIGNYFPDGARILDATAQNSESMQHSMSRALNGGRNRFLLWSGSTSGSDGGLKVPVFKQAEGVLSDDLACGWTLAVGAADLDGDLLPEIYFANDFGPDRLLHNLSRPGQLRFELLRGEKSLTTPNSKVLGRDSFKGMGVDFADLNGDGLPDIYVSNIAAEYALEESHFVWLSTGQIERMKDGIAPYVDGSEALGLSRSGWGWDARLADFNNDGVLEAIQATGFIKGEVNRWPELHELAMGNDQLLQHPGSWPRLHPGDSISGGGHNPFFVRARDGRFYDLAHDLGLDDNQISRGIAIGDVDGDGRLDFVVANQWSTSVFYHNESRDVGAFLGLNLLLPIQAEGAKMSVFHRDQAGVPGRGRPAIGATASVYLPDGRRLVSQVYGGNGHSGKCSPDIHFGLGQIAPETKLRVDLRWRDGNGKVCEKTLYLLPGWYTALLGL